MKKRQKRGNRNINKPRKFHESIHIVIYRGKKNMAKNDGTYETYIGGEYNAYIIEYVQQKRTIYTKSRIRKSPKQITGLQDRYENIYKRAKTHKTEKISQNAKG